MICKLRRQERGPILILPTIEKNKSYYAWLSCFERISSLGPHLIRGRQDYAVSISATRHVSGYLRPFAVAQTFQVQQVID